MLFGKVFGIIIQMHYIILFMAEYAIIVVCLVAAIYWLTLAKKDKLRLVIFGLVASLVGLALVKLGAAIFYDPRPFVTHNLIPVYSHINDNGFPSDHTVLAAVVALTIYSASKRLGGILFGLALAIGLARVLGNIHSPIDILGSLVFALLAGAVAYYLTPKLTERLKI